MREIKFRCWNKAKSLMFQAQDIDLRNLPFNDNLVYMQYTGLKDKNGNEIYEGDILYMPAFSPEKNIVRFNRGGFCLEPVLAAPLESSFWPDIKYAEDEGSEVIGNIYENPELLVNN